ncbi:ExeM/NucH family extracellular endonuclease [Hymenobacter sp. HSC-4F20]|uniref:ExeM/NucH family extracellular endonuclease n=1 Tax=Hymenobacter sp. HSC-4F20 TaxID=2864135 RepID=UPI001C73316B|nr:ExeM/NucH family extracellular endonuclease [Hymenobacter sp. HSC-4F20]MBX0290290.1 ExeM/NucH family extracellular endonuclease [Hymenobacter sp. HSC-4F20]
MRHCISLALLLVGLGWNQGVACAQTGAAQSAVTRIGQIQGSKAAATPGTYTVEAIVTGVYTGLNPGGFYVQEAPAASDASAATSDALFVVQANPTVKPGDLVRVTGTVQEAAAAPSFDQAVLTDPTVRVVSSGNPLPAFVVLPNASFSAAGLERYEGMRVQFSGPLTVSDVYNLQRRGELTLTPGGTLFQPTQFIDPNDNPATGTTSTGTSNLAAIRAYEAANLDRSILLDDGSSASTPQPIPYTDATFRTVRVGSKVERLSGILGYGFNQWRVQPLPGADAPVVRVVRPSLPAFGPLDLKLASFNVLNYFNGNGIGGGFPTTRGAKTLPDFARQRSKIIAALTAMNADVVGLTEIENDGTGPASAIQDLVNGLNQAMGAGTYAFVNDGGATQQPNNTDQIHCAILYKPAEVRLLGPALVASAQGVFERPPLAQLFITRRKPRPDTVAVVINHFKSKGSGTGPNADQNDGQGGSNDRRRVQAQGLVDFITTTVIPAGSKRVLCIGDYNANYEEDPIDIMRAAELVVVTPPTSASYVFKGLTGSLDHCIVTPNLVGFIDVHKWNINSFEPLFQQYDVAGAATDATSPFRSSDHDPVLIGLNFAGVRAANEATTRLFVYPAPTAGNRVYQLPTMPAGTGPLTLELTLPQGPPMLHLQGSAGLLQAELNRYTAHLPPGLYVVRLRGKGINRTQRVMKE